MKQEPTTLVNEQDAANALSEAWGSLIQYLAYEASKESIEGAVLSRLEPYPSTAFQLAWGEMSCDDAYLRCIGALMPGFAPDMPADALWWIWEAECAVREKRRGDEFEEALSNSVAERVLISAVRLTRHPSRRDVGFHVLHDMVERTIGGVFWNDSHRAVAALLHAGAPNAPQLAKRLAESSAGRQHWGDFLAQLRAGNQTYLAQGHQLADDAAWRNATLSQRLVAQREQLVRAAANYERYAAASVERDMR